MRGGTHRLAVWTVVVCVLATSCAAAADRQAGSRAGGTAASEPLAVRVGGDARALALVDARRPIASSTGAPPQLQPADAPPVTFRRMVDERAPLRVALIGDSVAFSLLPSLGSAA
ncbi:MAG: hypothetical protein QOI55_902, partial [Actinomycetota bacterium]|nr:hypothetical protein [Actinomycetota bacterium]